MTQIRIVRVTTTPIKIENYIIAPPPSDRVDVCVCVCWAGKTGPIFRMTRTNAQFSLRCVQQYGTVVARKRRPRPPPATAHDMGNKAMTFTESQLEDYQVTAARWFSFVSSFFLYSSRRAAVRRTVEETNKLCYQTPRRSSVQLLFLSRSSSRFAKAKRRKCSYSRLK